MSHLDQAATKELDKVDFDVRLRELVRIRASQLNGCAFCIDMHTKDARAAGETEQRIYALPAWRETPFFTSQERAALALTESVTLMPQTHVPDADFAAGGRAVQRRRARRAHQPHRHDQRVERHRRQHQGLGAGLLPAMSADADRLRAMHAGPQPLILPNVWDPVSARAFADAGFGALATSSSAVAATLGYRDGETPKDEMFAAVARIARSVDVPVTADIENGYGLTPAQLVAGSRGLRRRWLQSRGLRSRYAEPDRAGASG